jgi:hypothetical protein
MNNIFNHVKQNPYDITVTNHRHYTASTRSLDYVIKNIESDLSRYSSTLMHQNAYETVSSQQTFKRANAMLIMTDEKDFGEPSGCLTDRSYDELKKVLEAPDLLIDKMDLTLDLTVDEATQLAKLLGNSVKKNKRLTQNRVSNPSLVKYHNRVSVTKKVNINLSIESLEYEVSLKGDSCVITIFFEPISKNIRRVKVSFNPEKSHPHDLFMTFNSIQKVCGNRYKEVIEQAMITRVDYTVDIVGLSVEYLFCNLAKSRYSTTYISKNYNIEGKIIGADGGHRINSYDRLNKLKKEADHRKDKEGLKQLNDLPVITRIEVTMRPHRDKILRGFRLSDYQQFGSPFKGVIIYDVIKLLKIPEFSNNYEQAKFFGINNWKNNFIGAKEQEINRKIQKCEFRINDDSFTFKQSEVYKRLLRCLLQPTPNFDLKSNRTYF